MRQLNGNFDVLVVGGGLAGLTAAAYAAGAGRRVALLERSDTIGGRAVTTVEHGFHFNLGPHAWYIGGPGTRVLAELGIPLAGRAPRPAGAYAVLNGRLYTLPIGFVSLLSTDLLGLQGKLEAARLLGPLPRLDAAAFDNETLADWLDGHIGNPRARDVVDMFVRVSMYANAASIMSAGTSLAAFQLVLRHNVRYLHRGWQTVVDALQAFNRARGVELVRSAAVAEVLHDDRGVSGVRLADGPTIPASKVILTLAPDAARRLLPSAPESVTGRWSGVPSKAACLDVGLARLPRPASIVAFGVDQPLYYSVHSATADLAPRSGAAIHVAKYLPATGRSDASTDRAELESLLDMMQPGWRAEVVMHRYLPAMTVMHAIPLAATGGLRGRPDVEVREVPGLYLAGDWVGHEGTLANASVASAARAGRLAAERARGARERLPGAEAVA